MSFKSYSFELVMDLDYSLVRVDSTEQAQSFKPLWQSHFADVPYAAKGIPSIFSTMDL